MVICSEEGVQEIINELSKFNEDELAKIWCTFNVWRFPECLIHLKPKWWAYPNGTDYIYTLTDMKILSPFIRPINAWISNKIGNKKISREWNRERMTDTEFELWWAKHGNEDISEEAKKLLLIMKKELEEKEVIS